MSAVPSPAARMAAWEAERSRKIAAALLIAQYDNGLLTLDEFIAGLAGIRLDERQWAHPGPTYPVFTVATFARLLGEETEALTELDKEARLATARLAVEDEHSHGGTPTLDDGCGR
jgi:hypothetical protein